MNEYKENEWTKKDKDILEMIRNEGEKAEIPESLRPEAVVDRLKKEQKTSGKRRHKGIKLLAGGLTAAAACAALLVMTGAPTGLMPERNGDAISSGKESRQLKDESNMKPFGKGDTQTSEAETEQDSGKNPSIGESIVLAKTENEIYRQYEVIARERMNLYGIVKKNSSAMSMKDMAMTEGASVEDRADAAAGTANTGGTPDYSKTNIMTEGVDESDGVKTDGNYIYTCEEKIVNIVDIREEKMKKLGTIRPSLEKEERIQEIYVDGDRLYIISTCSFPGFYSCGTEDDVAVEENGSAENGEAAEEADLKDFTRLFTYDLTDRTKPVLAGMIRQDGSYLSSRKNGAYIYLFSTINIWGCKDKEGMIPELNGSKLRPDCFYISKGEAAQEFVVSAVDTGKPDKVCDELALLCDAYEVYVDQSSIYIYSEKYKTAEEDSDKNSAETEKENDENDDQTYTRIIRLSYESGKLNGENAVEVPGNIMDPFAIHGSEKGLEVLTTIFDDEDGSQNKNMLTIFDPSLKQTARLTDIAKGEEIYAARYLGDMVYFITYHNTDPLFSVDIADRKKPKILGFAKITGYSEYLHPYGDGLMLGIGTERDPESGDNKGIKLVMFDTSDPRNLKVIGTKVLRDYDVTSAEMEYKSVLVDPDRNLISFYSYNSEEAKDACLIFSWEKGSFRKEAELRIRSKEGIDSYDSRALYAGDRFYTVPCVWKGEQRKYDITAYDMKNSYKKLE